MIHISPEIPIGELIVASGLAKQDHIDRALHNSASSGLPIGLELVLMDRFDFDILANVVIAQSLIRDKLLTMANAVDALSLSLKKNITLKIALDVMAVDLKSESKNRLGSLLVDGEFISRKIHKECSNLSKSTACPWAGAVGVRRFAHRYFGQSIEDAKAFARGNHRQARSIR